MVMAIEDSNRSTTYHTSDTDNTKFINAELSETAYQSTASAYTFDSYQDDAGTTSIYPDAGTRNPKAITYVVLGLIGEAGEIANKWKKFIRDGESIPVTSDTYEDRLIAYKLELRAELGDVLWYVANLATELGANLGEVAAANYTKLNDRKHRDVLKGSGDYR